MRGQKAPAGSNEPNKSFGRYDHAVASSRLGRCSRLMACPRTAYLFSRIHQDLASNFGLRLLRSLRAALYPGRGYVGKDPFDGSIGGTSQVHPGLSLRRDTLMEMRTELNAARHTAT